MVELQQFLLPVLPVLLARGLWKEDGRGRGLRPPVAARAEEHACEVRIRAVAGAARGAASQRVCGRGGLPSPHDCRSHGDGESEHGQNERGVCCKQRGG